MKTFIRRSKLKLALGSYLLFMSVVVSFAAAIVAGNMAQAGPSWEVNSPVAPDFAGPTLSGESYHLADHIGKKMIVLNFFATWCGPCREELKYFEEFQNGNRDKVEIIGVDTEENPVVVKAFAHNMNLTYPILVDEGVLKAALFKNGVPVTMVIGVDGKIQYSHLGAIVPNALLEPYLQMNANLLQTKKAVTTEEFLESQRRQNQQLIEVRAPTIQPTAEFIANPKQKDSITGIEVVGETPQGLDVEISYFYSGRRGEKRIYIDCDPYTVTGAAPFGMRPAQVLPGQNKTRTHLSSYSETPEGTISVKITCRMTSRLDSATLAEKTVLKIKRWNR